MQPSGCMSAALLGCWCLPFALSRKCCIDTTKRPNFLPPGMTPPETTEMAPDPPGSTTVALYSSGILFTSITLEVTHMHTSGQRIPELLKIVTSTSSGSTASWTETVSVSSLSSEAVTIVPISTITGSSTDSLKSTSTQNTTSPAQNTTSPVQVESSTTSSTIAAVTSQRSVPKSQKKSNTGAIVGGVVGGVLGLALLVGLGFLLFKRRRTVQNRDGDRDHLAAMEKTRTPSPSPSNSRSLSGMAIGGAAATAAPAAPGAGTRSNTREGLYNRAQPSNERGLGAANGPASAARPSTDQPQAEIDGREVDSDGVSVRSPTPDREDDGETALDEPGVPRLPMYNRGEGGDGRSSSRAL